MFGHGKKSYFLYTEERDTKKQRLKPNLTKGIKDALDPNREVLIEELQNSIQDDGIIANDKNEDQAIREKVRERITKTRNQLLVFEKERDALSQEREVLITQKDKQIEELQKSIREDEIIANDENEEPAIREQARERINEKREQIDALENERDALEERPSLRERVKNIFKKSGLTVTAIILVVRTTIGVIVNALTKGLKSVATGVGNGLKTLGKKIAQILPGLTRTIVSFIFKTAGSVISFLRKNAWLCILRVVVFMVEKFQRRITDLIKD